MVITTLLWVWTLAFYNLPTRALAFSAERRPRTAQGPHASAPSWSGDTVNYFAFGSNMAKEVVEGRRGVRPMREEPAVCFGHRLAFTALGLPPFEPSFASLEPSEHPGDRCHGVLYTISSLDWLRICASEGVPVGYQVTTVNVTPYAPHALHEPLPTVTAQVPALTLRYVQPQSLLLNLPQLELPPSKRYLNLLRTGAKEKGIAEPWRRKLAEIRLASVF